MAALGKMGPKAKPAIPRLVGDLEHQDLYVRMAAAEAILTLDPNNPAVGPRLIDGMKTGGVYSRRESAKWTGSMGPRAKEALPQLRRLLQDNNASVRAAAEEAIKKIELPRDH